MLSILKRSLFRVYSFKSCSRRRTTVLSNITMHACAHVIIYHDKHPDIYHLTHVNPCCFIADYHDELHCAPPPHPHLHARTHARTRTRAQARAHAYARARASKRTRTRTRTHTHTITITQ